MAKMGLEGLDAFQVALQLAEEVHALGLKGSIRDQLTRASESVVLNTAGAPPSAMLGARGATAVRSRGHAGFLLSATRARSPRAGTTTRMFSVTKTSSTGRIEIEPVAT